MVYVIYAGYAQSNGASTASVWPHMWFLSKRGVTLELDGVKIDRYACSSERTGITGDTITGIGLFCHEFSHILGLPDIYSLSGLSLITMGTWDVMDSGCYNNNMRTPAGYSSYEKEILGWMTPTILNEAQTDLPLFSLESSNSAYKLVNPDNENEYYLLEYRSKSDKWDAFLGGEGMLVIQVNYDAEANSNNVVNSNGNYGMHLVPANGDFTSSSESSSIPFPGKNNVDAFTDFTTPSAIYSDGTAANRPITRIRKQDDRILFDFNRKIPTPVILEPTDITSSGFRANWEPVSEAKNYTVKIVARSTGEEKIYEKVVKNRYTFTNLDSEETWLYSVRAVGDDNASYYSEEKSINLKECSAVGNVEVDRCPIEVFTPSGIIVGVYGNTNAIRGLAKGIYIFKQGNNAKKIIIN